MWYPKHWLKKSDTLRVSNIQTHWTGRQVLRSEKNPLKSEICFGSVFRISERFFGWFMTPRLIRHFQLFFAIKLNILTRRNNLVLQRILSTFLSRCPFYRKEIWTSNPVNHGRICLLTLSFLLAPNPWEDLYSSIPAVPRRKCDILL